MTKTIAKSFRVPVTSQSSFNATIVEALVSSF